MWPLIGSFAKTAACVAILVSTTYAQDSPSQGSSVGGVRLTTPVDVTTCGKLPISWVFLEPGLVVDDSAFVTKIRVWVTNINVDQSRPVTTSHSSSIPVSSSSTPIPQVSALAATTTTSFTTVPPLVFSSTPALSIPGLETTSPAPLLPRHPHKRQQSPGLLNITIAESHPLLGYLNLTWSPAFLPPNAYYQLWMESVPNKGALHVRSSSDRFFVSSSADQSCLSGAFTRTFSAAGSLNTSATTPPSKGLQGGGIAGVVIGVVVGVGAAAFLIMWCMRRRQQSSHNKAEKDVIARHNAKNAAGLFGMVRKNGDSSSDKDKWTPSAAKTSRRKRASGPESNDSGFPALKYHGRTSSANSGPNEGSGSTESTIAGTYENDKQTSGKRESSNDLHKHYSYHGRKSGSVTSFTNTTVPPYSSVDSRDGILTSVDSHGRRRESYDALGRRSSREHTSKHAKRASAQSSRSQSVGGHYTLAKHTQEPEEIQMNPVDSWSGPLKRERTRSLPGGAPPPSFPKSNSTSPVGPSPATTAPTAHSHGYPDRAQAASPPSNPKLVSKPSRKPPPAYPESLGSNPSSPISSSAPTHGFYGPPQSASNHSASSLTNRSTGNLNSAVAPPNPGRKMSSGRVTPITDFSGFAGAREGPVHYLIPDMPPENAYGR